MSYTLNLREEVKRKGVWEEGVKEGRETKTKEEYEVKRTASGEEQSVTTVRASQGKREKRIKRVWNSYHTADLRALNHKAD